MKHTFRKVENKSDSGLYVIKYGVSGHTWVTTINIPGFTWAYR